MPNPKKLNESKGKTLENSGILIGLSKLKRTLERDFFASADIDIHDVTSEKVELVIHLKCNFGLTESLFHLNNGNWGNFQKKVSQDVKTSPFQSGIFEMAAENDMLIEIKELSIHLKDTSLIISKLTNYPIQDYLEGILNAVSGNFVHFTKGLTQMPYEVFVPIYEETSNNFQKAKTNKKWVPSYLDFWGLYFEGEDESQVYDIKNQIIIEESDFFLLNYWE